MIEKIVSGLYRPLHNYLFLKRFQSCRSRSNQSFEIDWNDRIPDKRHLYSTNEEKTTAIAIRILKLLDEWSRELDLNVFLAYGTLLGAIRHKGFIPWDDDIDVFMTRTGFKELTRNLQNLPEELAMVPMAPNFFKLMDLSSIISKDGKRGVAVDIFIVDDTKPSVWSFFNVHNRRRVYFPKRVFHPPRRIPFENEVFSAPNEAKKILETLYGDFMQLPELKDRKPSHIDYSKVQIESYGKMIVDVKNCV